MMPVVFHFVVLRYRGAPAAADFVNVGVLLQAPDVGFLGMRTGSAPDRVRVAFPDTDTVALESALSRIEGRLTALQSEPIVGGDVALFAGLALQGEEQNFAWSEMGIGVCAGDPREELSRLYDEVAGGRVPEGVLPLPSP